MRQFSAGSLVQFRGREWVVMPSEDAELLLLRPLTGDPSAMCGVFLPAEGSRVRAATFPPPTADDIGDFESSRLLHDAARLLIRHGAGPFRSLGHLSCRPRPYQLVPLLMALRASPVRLLIADDVGVGKTIEACLIARELLDRGWVRRLAVLCPPYLCEQWQEELANKFSIHAEVVGSSTIARLERQVPRADQSVYRFFPHLVVSIDFIKQESKRHEFLAHCPELVIVDEAHGCARPAGASASQQQRYDMVSRISRDPNRHLMLVTATPHSGIEESFQSLIGLLKPDFGQMDIATIDEKQRRQLSRHFVQRRRSDVEQWMGTGTKFPERVSEEVAYRLSRSYRELFQEVYRFTREKVATGDIGAARNRVNYWAALALLRCVMSSPRAGYAALNVKAGVPASGDSTADEEITGHQEVLDFTSGEGEADVPPAATIAASLTRLGRNDRERLVSFAQRAAQQQGEHDEKMRTALHEIRKLLTEGFRPIVFCRYVNTANYVAGVLTSSLSGVTVECVTGELADEERKSRVSALAGTGKYVLVATDCLSEGINLQEWFTAVLHYDLPWNPNRLEQREGRVDRFGQAAERVKTVLLHGQDNPIDGAVLNVLLRKAKKIHETLGITVPLPADSETVMESVLKALYLKEPAEQLSFLDDIVVQDVHRDWDRAAEREKRSRTMFAQHAIKPDEVAKELEVSDLALGDPDAVERFVATACQRLGSPTVPSDNDRTVRFEGLPKAVSERVPHKGNEMHCVFEPPVDGNQILAYRTHPLVAALGEYVLETALNPEGARRVAARCEVSRSDDVSEVTTLLLLRMRFLLKDSPESIGTLAEECVVAGFRGVTGTEKWMENPEAERLLDSVRPAANVPPEQKKHWADTVLKRLDSMQPDIERLAREKALQLADSHERVTEAAGLRKVKVEPLLPVDILALSVILPRPRV